MGAFQPWHWLVVIAVAALMFGGKGKLSGLMGDAAKGIKAFREGLKGDEKVEDEPVATPLPRTDSEKDKIVS